MKIFKAIGKGIDRFVERTGEISAKIQKGAEERREKEPEKIRKETEILDLKIAHEKKKNELRKVKDELREERGSMVNSDAILGKSTFDHGFSNFGKDKDGKDRRY